MSKKTEKTAVTILAFFTLFALLLLCVEIYYVGRVKAMEANRPIVQEASTMADTFEHQAPKMEAKTVEVPKAKPTKFLEPVTVKRTEAENQTTPEIEPEPIEENTPLQVDASCKQVKNPSDSNASEDFTVVAEDHLQVKSEEISEEISEEVVAFCEETQDESEETSEDAYYEALDEASNYTDQELEWMACVIYQEAGGDNCCDETRFMVADVVLNRVESPDFPNTIYDVLTQYRQYGMFCWTGIVWPDKAYTEAERAAVERAYDIAHRVLEGEHSELYGQGYIWQAEFIQGSGFWQDGMWFGR